MAVPHLSPDQLEQRKNRQNQLLVCILAAALAFLGTIAKTTWDFNNNLSTLSTVQDGLLKNMEKLTLLHEKQNEHITELREKDADMNARITNLENNRP